MFTACTHKDVAASLEAIGAAFAIFELRANSGSAALVSANTRFEEFAARPVLECIGLPLSEFLPRYVEKQIGACFNSCLGKLLPQEVELVIEREAASRYWRLVASPVINHRGSASRVIVTLIEITERKILEQKLEMTRQRFEAVVETAYDGIITIDQNQSIMLMNESAKEIFGVVGETVIGESLSRFIPRRSRVRHADYINTFRHSEVKVRPMQPRATITGLRPDGSEFPAEVTISKIKVGNETEMTAMVRDVSERTRLFAELTKAATHDPLTGIFNRRHGAAVLKSEISRCKRFGHTLSIVLFDLDHFKAINDAYGHASGDLVLNAVVEATIKTLRDTDAFCRWGGEEFLVLLPETARADALNWAERARDAVAAQPVVGSGELAMKITASFGVAAYNEAQDGAPEALIQRADKALYRAKEEGRNRVVAGD